MFSKSRSGIKPHPFPIKKFCKLLRLYKLVSINLPLTTGASNNVPFIVEGNLKSSDQNIIEVLSIKIEITITIRFIKKIRLS